MEEEILNELKTLTEILKQDIQLRSDELQLQIDKTANEKELYEIAKIEHEQQQLEIDAEKAKAEQRALQIEDYIKQQSVNDEERKLFNESLITNTEQQNIQVIEELNSVNENLVNMLGYQENTTQYQSNTQTLGTMAVGILIVGFGIYLLYKFSRFVVLKIINMIS